MKNQLSQIKKLPCKESTIKKLLNLQWLSKPETYWRLCFEKLEILKEDNSIRGRLKQVREKN